jgi:hypothetical protein
MSSQVLVPCHVVFCSSEAPYSHTFRTPRLPLSGRYLAEAGGSLEVKKMDVSMDWFKGKLKPENPGFVMRKT